MNTSTSRTGNKLHMGSMTKIIEMFHEGYSSFKHRIICVAIFNMIAIMYHTFLRTTDNLSG
jgi:hypothetical protein